MNLFITGTDTNVGKTTVSAWICSRVAARYWKPIQTGHDSDSSVIKLFASNVQIIPEAYKLPSPLSAYDAAKIDGITIDIAKLKSTNIDKAVIEGAGGVFVPIADDFFMIDLIKATNSSALVVASAKLGTINHTLLTIHALRNYNIPIIGIIVVGEIADNIRNTIEHFANAKILSTLPITDNLVKLFESTTIPQEILEILS